MVPCQKCGALFKDKIQKSGERKRFCSAQCVREWQTSHFGGEKSRDRIHAIIAKYYPSRGADVLARRLNLKPTVVQDIAYKNGVKLDQALYNRRVHESAKKFMLADNPMKKPEVAAKMSATQRERGHYDQQHPNQIVAARAMQLLKPTKLELKLFGYLDGLGVTYEPQAGIKGKFLVDALIGSLILQADGDYWHGHPRFEPLSQRQLAQQRRDRSHDAYSRACGYTVIRIWESDMTLELVRDALLQHGVLKSP
jgi:G:T-mismatch repair DNA endonuclease (very short patch repair protein)